MDDLRRGVSCVEYPPIRACWASKSIPPRASSCTLCTVIAACQRCKRGRLPPTCSSTRRETESFVCGGLLGVDHPPRTGRAHITELVKQRAQFVQFLGRYPQVKEQNLYIRLLLRSQAYRASLRFRAFARW